jgi:hypothetical protein
MLHESSPGQFSPWRTITPPKLCWRFTGMRRVGHNGRQFVALGAKYAARGCRTAEVDNVLEPLGEQPAQYYVTLASKTFPAGAVRSQLAKARP